LRPERLRHWGCHPTKNQPIFGDTFGRNSAIGQVVPLKHQDSLGSTMEAVSMAHRSGASTILFGNSGVKKTIQYRRGKMPAISS
jgi:hypothetical protein